MRTVPFGPGPTRVEPFDPVAMAGLLGAPVAVLTSPVDRIRVGSPIGQDDQPAVAVMVTHRFDSADPHAPAEAAVVASVWTRRLHLEPIAGLSREIPETSVQGHLRQTLDAYLLDSTARRLDQPGGRERLTDIARQTSEQPHNWAMRSVTVDGQNLTWEYGTDHDPAADEPVIAVGGRLDQILVAVVGPEPLLRDEIALTLHSG